MTRKYTGWDSNATGRRAGTEKLVQLLTYVFNNEIWNNGTWNVRNMNNPNLPSPKPSVHGTGRAADLSWRKRNDGKGSGNYDTALRVTEFLAQYADLLTIEEIHDYWPAPFGRGWRCDRATWSTYSKPSIGGAPGGDWIHLEISNDHADDPGYFARAFEQIFSGDAKPSQVASAPAQAPSASPTPETPDALPYPGKPIKKGSRGQSVKIVQGRLGITQDGSFGPQTEASVKAWQTKNGLLADGVVGPKSWAVLVA